MTKIMTQAILLMISFAVMVYSVLIVVESFIHEYGDPFAPSTREDDKEDEDDRMDV